VFADCRLHICLYYREILVKELTTSSPEGCRISHGHTYDASNLDQVLFPYPEDNGQRKNIEKLLSHLERGVVLWMAPDGLYAKRLCQSRIYWDGPLALCSDRPNKLERDQTCKLFDTQQFLSGNICHYLLEWRCCWVLPWGFKMTRSVLLQAEVFLLLEPESNGIHSRIDSLCGSNLTSACLPLPSSTEGHKKSPDEMAGVNSGVV
jgi:hypothetical protein